MGRWMSEGKQAKKNYLSNSEDTTISLTVCCETICVEKMGDLQEVSAGAEKGSFIKKTQLSEKPLNPSTTT